MRAYDFLPDVPGVLERRGEPAYRLEQACLALTRSLILKLRPSRGKYIDAACGRLATKDLGGRTAVWLPS